MSLGLQFADSASLQLFADQVLASLDSEEKQNRAAEACQNLPERAAF